MSGFKPLMLVGVTVLLNIASAIVLKEAVGLTDPDHYLLVGILFAVVLINLLRVLFWAAIHRRYDLSHSYPLTSIFFPLILLVSLAYGEQISLFKLLGTLLITVGVALHISSGQSESGHGERFGESR